MKLITTNIDALISYGFTASEAEFLAKGNTLIADDELYYREYRLYETEFGFTLIEATLEKNTSGAIWDYLEYEF